MLFINKVEHDEVIEVDKADVSTDPTKSNIRRVLKGHQSVPQSERHATVAIRATVSWEAGLVTI